VKTDPATDTAYLADYDGGRVFVINNVSQKSGTYAPDRTLTGLSNPNSVFPDVANDRLFVSNRDGGTSYSVRVVENMSWLELPDGSRMELFGVGGGQRVAESLGRSVGAPVPLLGQVPIDVALREGGDSGTPVVLSHPDSPSAVALRGVARSLARRARGLAGRSLGLTPVAR